ncbi:hypothetical protein K9M50_01725 [Patescibacteria group bacterium]|nr:hypothetical protein [Patescibacteria group bacterium]
MSKITKKLEVFIAKVEKVCSQNENVNPEDCTKIIDYSLSLSFLIYDPEDANLFKKKMNEKWSILKEKSHLKKADAEDILSIIDKQLNKTLNPEDILDKTYIKHVKGVIKGSTRALEEKL